MDRREVNGVKLVINLTVEALIGALRVVDDVDREVAVVPVAAVLPADLLTGRGGVRAGPAPNRLVVSKQRSEPGERAKPVHGQRVAEIPRANIELREQLVELPDQVGGPVLTGNSVAPLVKEAAQPVTARTVEVEDSLVLVQEIILVDSRARSPHGPPVDAGHPCKGAPEDLGVPLVEQPSPSSRLHGNVEGGERVDQAPVGSAPTHEDGDVPIGHALVVEVENQLRNPSRLALLVTRVPDRHLGAATRRAVGSHSLGDPPRNRGGEGVRGVDNPRTAASVGRDLERGDVRVPAGEGHDVANVGPTPLVNGLVVVADDAELNGGAGQQLDEPLLRGVHVLVLVDNQMAQLGPHRSQDGLALQFADGSDDLLAVGEQAVSLQCVQIVQEHPAERLRHRVGVEEFVFDDVDAAQKAIDRSEQAAPRVQPLQVQARGLPSQEGRQLVIVEDVVGLVAGDVGLEKPEAVGVDGADKQPAELSGRRDDLQVTAAVPNRGECSTLKPRSPHDWHLPGLDVGLAVRPLDNPAADFADGQLRVVIGQRTADEVVGKHMGVAVAAAPAGDEPVDRVKVAA